MSDHVWIACGCSAILLEAFVGAFFIEMAISSRNSSAFKAEMWKWLLSPPRPTPNWIQSILGVLEHNLCTLPLGLIGGIVGLIFPPLFFLCGVCILLAFHRKSPVKGLSRAVQGGAYLALALGLFLGLWKLNTEVQRKLADNNTAFARLVASVVGSSAKSPRISLSLMCDTVSLPVAYHAEIWALDMPPPMGAGLIKQSASPFDLDAFWPGRSRINDFGYRCQLTNHGTGVASEIALAMRASIMAPVTEEDGTRHGGAVIKTSAVSVLVPKILGPHDSFIFYACNFEDDFIDIELPTYAMVNDSTSKRRERVGLVVASTTGNTLGLLPQRPEKPELAGTVPRTKKAVPASPPISRESFVFLYPAGVDHDNNLLLLWDHRGSEDTFNIKAMVSDMGLALKHKERASTPEEIPRESFALRVPEIDAIPSFVVGPEGFQRPLSSPDKVDFMVDISFRGGQVMELFQAVRVGNEWARQIRVDDLIKHVTVLSCRDPQFSGDGDLPAAPSVATPCKF
jgi:hypothetical protein